MKQQPSKISLMLPILLALLSIGCGLSSRLAPKGNDSPIVATRTPLPTFTPTPQGAGFIDVPTITPQAIGVNDTAPTAAAPQPAADTNAPAAAAPTTTATLVIQDTPTPALPTETPTPSQPQVTVGQDMNVRGGPGTNYPIVGSAKSGQASAVTGRSNDGSWLQVEYPSKDGTGWVYTSLVSVSGDVNSLPVAEASMAPLPAAQPTAVPKKEEAAAAPAAPAAPQYQFTPGSWFASGNGDIVQFKGRIKDDGGRLVNGFSVLVDNWSWKVLAHPSGASHWYPEKGPGEWDVVMPNRNSAQGWWWLSVVSYNCDFMSGFDSLCSNYTRLSEEIKIEVRSPDEAIINADWICHWDCNKGIYTNWSKDDGYSH